MACLIVSTSATLQAANLSNLLTSLLLCVNLSAAMDVDDKIKRFRLHVVKEIYQTERDYTDSLEFTVDVSCDKFCY